MEGLENIRQTVRVEDKMKEVRIVSELKQSLI